MKPQKFQFNIVGGRYDGLECEKWLRVKSEYFAKVKTLTVSHLPWIDYFKIRPPHLNERITYKVKGFDAKKRLVKLVY